MKNVIFIFLSVLIITKLLSSEPLVKPSKVNFGEKLNKSFNDRNMTKSGSKRSVQLPNASEIELLQRLLDVSPERLRFMKKAIERVESMNPEQKKNIKERLSKLKNSPPHIRKREIGKLRSRHEKLNKYWKDLDFEKRKLEITKFQSLSSLEKDNYLKRIKNK
jgi:hypothetical protein